MKVPTEYSDYITIENGTVCRVVTASWYSKDCNIIKQTDKGEIFKRNLYSCTYWGYCVAFPGFPFYEGGKTGDIAELENWCQIKALPSCGNWSSKITFNEIQKVCSVYPSFRYVLNKYPIKYRIEFIEILTMWLKHPGLELILAAGYAKVGMSNGFWGLSEPKQKEICRFMRLYPQFSELTYRSIQSCLKSKNPCLYAEYIQNVESYERAGKYWYEKITFEDFCYLKKQRGIKKDSSESLIKRKLQIFRDVLRMLKESHHDINDSYWRHPKNLLETHDKLVEEARIKKETEELAKRKEEAKKMKLITKRFISYASVIDGFSIFVTEDYNEWKKQADALHQCICAGGYYQRMMNRCFTIVFIQKKKQPIATAEIRLDGSIGQFYANELDRSNCLPAPEVKAAFEKWMQLVPKRIFNLALRHNTKRCV